MQNKFPDNIEGKFINLKKITESDAELIYKWRSGVSGRYLRQPADYSVASQKNWIQTRGENEVNYMIVDISSGIKVGMIGIYEVNDFDKIANIGRLLLDEAYLVKSNPFGLEALLLTHNFLFNELHFRKMTGDILAINEAMYKLQIFLGMKKEGYLEKQVLISGNYEDLYIMSLFAADFTSKYQKKINFLLKSFKL